MDFGEKSNLEHLGLATGTKGLGKGLGADSLVVWLLLSGRRVPREPGWGEEGDGSNPISAAGRLLPLIHLV